MDSQHQIRAVVFRDGDSWVAQCLEYDIGVQAADLEMLQARLGIALRLECETSIEIHGSPFAGISPAPQHFHDLWDRRSGNFTPTDRHSSPKVELEYAMCA